MTTIVFGAFLLTLAAQVSSAAESPEADSTVPHVERQGRNLIVDPSLKSKENWSFLRDAEYDASTSRSDDASGSMKLLTPLPNASMVLSDLIAVEPGKRYTYGFYFKTAGGPTFVGGQISLHDHTGKYLRNDVSGFGGTTQDGEWQEYVLPFTVPEGVALIGCQAFKADNTRPGGVVWADDFYLGEGLGLDQPPAAKRPFDGGHVRVDSLGNFEVMKNNVWTPFFPLCMYADNHRDWSVYSRQGWNTNIWTGDAGQVKQAQDAKSDFNPDGMMAGFSISQYTSPSGWAYNDLTDLNAKLKGIFDQGLGDNLLLYYWDNEVHHEQWQVPVDVVNTIRNVDVDSSGRRLHPIYALQGTYNNARVHAARGVVDVSGTYFGSSATDMSGTGQGDSEGLFILDHHERQTSPAAFAQFNEVDGPGDMRLRLYNSIILGARAMGYWRDCYKACDEPFMKSVGPVDEKPWWPDFPNLRREVDLLLPVIREPHWTTWKVKVDPPDKVRVGTRDHNGEGCIILVNQTNHPQMVTVAVEGLGYTPTEVRGVFDNKKIASISNASFSMTLPTIGVNSGTNVVRLVSSDKKP